VTRTPTRRRASPSRRLLLTVSRLTGALLASALAGVLLAALVLPVFAGAGLAAKTTADQFLELPVGFEAPDLPVRSRMVAADGSHIAWLFRQNRVQVPLERVPEHVRAALLAIEDSRFYEHNGIDAQGVLRAAYENATAGRITQGASTLTQQYVKNALIAEADTPEELRLAREQTLDRKLREARLAMAVERALSKDEILERYLNLAYFGNGTYGIEAAAQFYFAKGADQLTVAEGALLVGLVQSPSVLDPLKNLSGAVARRDVVLRRMAEVEMLSTSELVAALDEPPALKPSLISSGCRAPGVVAPFFCDYVLKALENTPLGAALGETPQEREQRLLTRGLTIRTTLDPRAQADAERAIGEGVPPSDPSAVAAVFTSVAPGSGAVNTMAVNRTFAEGDSPRNTKVNLALGGSSGMQAGSTFKPFVLAAALEQGLPLHLTLRAPPTYESKVFVNCDGRSCDNPYVVHNAGDSNAGVHDVISATHGSVNTFYIQLEERTGVERPAAIAESLGLRQFSGGKPSAPLHRGGSFVLGTNEVSPLAMATAYATFAAHGLYCPPRPLTGILDASGEPVPLPEQSCQQVLAPEIADTVTAVLRGNIDGSSPYRTGARATIGRPAAGKTGSTNGSKAAWFVGYTPRLAAAVWVGKPVPEPLRDITIGGTYYRQVYGGSLPAPIWGQAMSAILEGVPPVEMPPPVVSNPRSLGRDSRDDDDEEEEEEQRRPRR
jgi:membrane peptidoglycan carboxypeptidase